MPRDSRPATISSEAAPISPGDVLRDEIGTRAGIRQDDLAAAMGVSRLTVSQIINGKRTVTADMALRLGRVLDTSPEFWLNLQRAVDLHERRAKLRDALAAMPVLRRRQAGEP
jgi:addiction module HigA family antidote